MLFATILAATTLVLPPEDEKAAMFTAAGFVRQGAEWRTRDCQGMEGSSYSPGHLDAYGDANRDGRPDGVISEGSAICYGMAGQKFWLLAKDSGGKWRVMGAEIGMPDFLDTTGVDGWPDLQVGGPGFCFPILRWNGRAYAHNRYEYEGKACTPPAP